MYYDFYEYGGEDMVKGDYGVGREGYKLIDFYKDIDVWELYDLEGEGREMDNVYGEKEYEGVVREVKSELGRLEEEYKDGVGF